MQLHLELEHGPARLLETAWQTAPRANQLVEHLEALSTAPAVQARPRSEPTLGSPLAIRVALAPATFARFAPVFAVDRKVLTRWGRQNSGGAFWRSEKP